MAFLFDEAALPRSVGYRLVLKGALASLVAHRAVQGMVEEKELEYSLLGLAGCIGLGEHLLAVGDLHEAGRLQARAARTGHLDEAHPAHPDRLHPRVVAKTGNEDPGPFGRLDNELSLACLHDPPVDGDRDGRGGFEVLSHGEPCPEGMDRRRL